MDKDVICNDALIDYNNAQSDIQVYAKLYQDAFDDREQSMYVLAASAGTLIGVWLASTFTFKKKIKNYKAIQLRLKSNGFKIDVPF